MAININSIVIDDASKIIMKERQIILTDEKLKSILVKTYERAIIDTEKPKWYNHYGIFFSISTTLLISLVTSSFQGIGQIDANSMKILAWIVFAVCFIAGIVSLVVSTFNKHKYNTNSRDNAVIEIFQQHCSD